ncbi:hypothetical protein BH10ACT3_BH10ACT3_01380 [soil metagenome]
MKRTWTSVLAMTVLAAIVLTLSGGASAGAAENEETSERPLGTADRVLVFSVPTMEWGDLDLADTPNLKRLLGDSVVADLSVRSVSRQTTATDGYATLNAGTRAKGTPFATLAFVAGLSRGGGSDLDGDPVEVPPGAFATDPATEELPTGAISAPESDPVDPDTIPPEAGETYDGTPAAEEFARRTGVLPGVGEVFNFGLVSMLAMNDSLLFGAEIGALGTALGDAGVDRAIIANGDHGEGSDDVDFRREASVGLMDGDGLVAEGRVGRTLLEDNPKAPFGTRYDNPEVESAFAEFWDPNSVVLVEASDMVRAEDAKALSTEAQQVRLRRQALERSDELLGRLLQHVDLAKDAVMVIAPYATDEGNSLTVAAVHAPGVAPGLLSSGTTRRACFVQTVDLAPTIASLVDVDAPTSMEGTLMERKGSGGDFADRLALLVDSNDAARFRDKTVGLASTLFVLAQLVLWALAIFTMSRSNRRLRSGVEIATLGVLAYLPVTYLAGALPFYRWGSLAYWGFVIAVSAAAAIFVYQLTRRFLVDPLIGTLGGIVLFLSLDIIVGGPLQFNTVFGYTPTVAGRFAGMGNPAFSMFAASAIMLSALLAYRIGGRRGTWIGVALLAWTVVLDGSPFWGQDVGGALALIPSVCVTAWMLLGLKVRIRTAIIWGLASVLGVIALGLVDLSRPPAERTHLGRLLADVRDNGFEAFQTVVLRKLDANLSVLASSIWTLMLPVVFVFIAFLFWKAPWRLRTIAERIPQERAAVAGLITAMLLGFALNDSGIAVPGMMLGVVSASLIHLMLRVDDGLPRQPGGEPAGADPDASTALDAESPDPELHEPAGTVVQPEGAQS